MLARIWKGNEPLYTVGGIVNWWSYYGDTARSILKNQKQNYHTTQQCHSWWIDSSWFSIYLKKKKILIQKKLMNISVHSALFTIAKKCKQPQYTWKDEQIKKIWMGNSHTKEWNAIICNSVDGSREYYA